LSQLPREHFSNSLSIPTAPPTSYNMSSPPINNSTTNSTDNNIKMTSDAAPANEETPVKVSSETVGGGGCKEFFLYDNGRRDVQAFYFNQFGRSILFISFMFLSLAVLEFANEQVSCEWNSSGTEM
jgi:hypothetical protein